MKYVIEYLYPKSKRPYVLEHDTDLWYATSADGVIPDHFDTHEEAESVAKLRAQEKGFMFSEEYRIAEYEFLPRMSSHWPENHR